MKDEERLLWERYHMGSPQAADDLLYYYMGLVVFWVRKVARIAPWADRNDLMQEGLLTLLKVFEKFDPLRGYAFGAFAGKWIQGALLDYLEIEQNLTDYLYRTSRKVSRAQETLQRRWAREPTIAEIAEEGGLTERQVQSAFDALAIVHAEELDREEWKLPINSITPETSILVDELLLQLEERDRFILSVYYYEGYTDEEIAELRGLRALNVRIIRFRALKKLKKLVKPLGQTEKGENLLVQKKVA